MHLGLSDRQFFQLTPRQYHLLLDQHREQTKHREWMTGIIASTVANFSMHAPKNALKPSDFMPSAKKSAAPEKLNRRQIAANVRAFLESRRPNGQN